MTCSILDSREEKHFLLSKKGHCFDLAVETYCQSEPAKSGHSLATSTADICCLTTRRAVAYTCLVGTKTIVECNSAHAQFAAPPQWTVPFHLVGQGRCCTNIPAKITKFAGSSQARLYWLVRRPSTKIIVFRRIG